MGKSAVFIGMIYALTWGGAFAFCGWADLGLAAACALPLIWLSVVDLNARIIPDSATIAIALIGLAVAWITGQDIGARALAAGAVLAVFWLGGEVYYRLRGRDGFGIGDAKLLGAMVAGIGLGRLWIVVFLAATGGIVAIITRRVQGGAGDEPVSFGPFLAYAFFVTLLVFPQT